MVEWDGLENRCGFRLTEGSNPSLSAEDTRYSSSVFYFKKIKYYLTQVAACYHFLPRITRIITDLKKSVQICEICGKNLKSFRSENKVATCVTKIDTRRRM